MNTKYNISEESYKRLQSILGNPEEYLSGKICDYQLLNRIDGFFFHNLDKEYLKDYFLIKDWVHFSFYSGHLLKKIKEQANYKSIPIENMQLMWDAFNANKIEKDGKENRYYHEKRYQYIPDFASLILKKSKNYNNEKLLILLEDLIINMSGEMDGYYLARNCAQLMGDYLTTHREVDENIFEYLKEKQNIIDFDFHLVFYDYQLKSIYHYEKIDKIFSIINEQRPHTTLEEVIKESLEKNAFHIIKYIHIKHNYQFNENQLTEIMNKEKSSFGMESTQYVIDNFQPVKLIEQIFPKVFSDYKYSNDNKKTEFYKNNLELLKRKVPHDKLNEMFPNKNIKTAIKKI